MIVSRAQLFFTTIFLAIELNHCVFSLTAKDIFTPQADSDTSETDLLAIIRVPRDTVQQQFKELQASESASVPVSDSDSGKETVVRKARDSKFPSDKYTPSYRDGDRGDRSLKPEDNAEDDRGTKSNTALGKRCTTCDGGYLRSSSYDRGRDRYDRYDRDPYSSYSSRSRYDPYDRYYERDRYDDYDRDGYRDTRSRNRYSSSNYDRYEPRDRYYSDRGTGYDNRGYGYRGYDYRDRDYYSPSSRDRYDTYSPYDDYYSRGYDSYSSRGSGRPEYYGSGGTGYARGYSYGDRDRYGGGGGGGYGSSSGYGGSGYGSGGSGYGSGYGSYGGGYGSGYGSGYSSSGGGSRYRYPSSDYDSGYRYTSYLYGRPSSTTTDTPKNSDSEQGNTASPSQGSSSARSK